MPLRLRLLLLVSALAAVVLGAAVVVTVALHRVESNRTLVSDLLEPAGLQTRALLVSVVDQETGQRGFVLTGDRDFLLPYQDGYRDFRQRLDDLRADFRGDATMTAAIQEVDDAAMQWRRVGARPEIAARQRSGVGAAALLVRRGTGKRAFDQVRASVADLQRLVDRRTNAARRADDRALRLLRLSILASRLVTLVFIVVIAVLLRRWLLVPVAALRGRMREVAAGRIDEEVLVDGPPEVAAIGRDAESMRRRIVAELAAAQAATEALTQHSPVVAGLRRELSSGRPPASTGLDVAGVMLSAEGVLAGDWWEAVQRPDGSTALIVADVSGHGAEAGLVALRFKQRITALLDTDLDLATAFEVATHRGDEDVERFLSCLLVVVDPEAGRVSWINAGHPPALLVRRDDAATVVELEPTGPLISSVTSGWTVDSAPIGAEDMLLVCTDGVLEARNHRGEEFGNHGVLDVVRRLRRWSPEEAVAECSEAVRQFAADVRRDDVTCVAVALSGR